MAPRNCIILLIAASHAYGIPTVTTSHFNKRQLNGWLGSLGGLFGYSAEYDYVVVGGGTAGLVMAARLSEDPKVTVAVIEGGGYYQISNILLSQTPSGDVYWTGSSPKDRNPLVDWGYITTPQVGAGQRSMPYARGKCLGGSSARNFMIYQRGSRGSYQSWADAVGDQSYSFDNWLPYFKKSVHFTKPDTSRRAHNASATYNETAFSPTGGPLDVSFTNYAGPFSSYMDGALKEIGIADTQDFNSGSLLGSQYTTSTIQPAAQIRESSQTAFLTPDVLARGNLKVYIMTSAQKILFNSNKVATGVVCKAGMSTFNIKVKKEVILSAGAFQSPQLLMLSGVGPSKHLRSKGITVIADRPGVGQGMQDHVFFGPTYPVQVETFTRLANDIPYVLSQFLGPYSRDHSGPLTNPVADYLGWEKLPQTMRSNFSATVLRELAAFGADWPEVEYLSAPGYIGDFASLPSTQPKDGRQYASILAALVAPTSRGSVSLASANPDDLPIINPNWLTTETDQQVAIAAYKRVREAFASKYMSNVLTGAEYFPGLAVQTDAQILETIQKTVQTVWHAACTCKMGKASDPMSVVDPQARVYGVSGVRVVDASAFNLLPPGHPQSTVYALAEKISDAIKRG